MAQYLLTPPDTLIGSCSNEHCQVVHSTKNCKLYLGCSTTARDANFLQQEKICAVLNVAKDVQVTYPNFVTHVLHLPLDDSTLFTITKEQFEQACVFVQTCIAQGKNVLVHCSAGVSRSATMMIAILMHGEKWTLLEAWKQVKKARKFIYPNKQFCLQLVDYEMQLLGSNSISKTQIMEYHEDQT